MPLEEDSTKENLPEEKTLEERTLEDKTPEAKTPDGLLPKSEGSAILHSQSKGRHFDRTRVWIKAGAQ